MAQMYHPCSDGKNYPGVCLGCLDRANELGHGARDMCEPCGRLRWETPSFHLMGLSPGRAQLGLGGCQVLSVYILGIYWPAVKKGRV